jgi:hypothetical protein
MEKQFPDENSEAFTWLEDLQHVSFPNLVLQVVHTIFYSQSGSMQNQFLICCPNKFLASLSGYLAGQIS